MAKATVKIICKECGKEFEATATKYNRREADAWEAWAVEHITTCPECKKAAAQAKAKSRTAQIIGKITAAAGVELVALTGSEKQIAWAEDLRAASIVDFVDTYGLTDEEIGDNAAMLAQTINSEPSAKWWIDNRDVDAYDRLNKLAERMM